MGCVLRQNTAQLSIVNLTPMKFAYQCEFDGVPDARFSLQEAEPGAPDREQAVELNGAVPQQRVPAASAPEGTRRSVLLAALAVSLLWDPATR